MPILFFGGAIEDHTHFFQCDEAALHHLIKLRKNFLDAFGVFDYFHENSRAPVLEEIMQQFHLGRDDAYSLLSQLEKSHHILLLPGTQRILMANPFSITTPFTDIINGKKYFANCAWDTISLHVMLRQDTTVDAYCHHCAEPISISLSQEKIMSSKPASPLIYLSVPVSKWYDNLINTCSNNMVYFGSQEHLDEWLVEHPKLRGEALTVAKMIDVCKPLSRRRMNLDYARPPGNELTTYWDSLGLRGDFWKL